MKYVFGPLTFSGSISKLWPI